MEEKKNNQTQKKLSYEELSQAASELHMQYQKLVAEYQKAMEALQNRDFEYTSFFVQMLFKVIEHPEAYTDEFYNWSATHIQDILMGFEEAGKPKDEKQGNEAE